MNIISTLQNVLVALNEVSVNGKKNHELLLASVQAIESVIIEMQKGDDADVPS